MNHQSRTTFTSELDLRRWTEAQCKTLFIPYSKIEPSLNSTLGLPDYTLTIDDLPAYVELKCAKPLSKNFQSEIRPNQKKRLKGLKRSNQRVGILVCIQNTSEVFGVLIRPETLTGKFDFSDLRSKSLALPVSAFGSALEFFKNDQLPYE